jgi:hypothetical protein
LKQKAGGGEGRREGEEGREEGGEKEVRDVTLQWVINQHLSVGRWR